MKKIRFAFITTLFCASMVAMNVAFPTFTWLISLSDESFNACNNYFGFECGVFTKFIYAFIQAPRFLDPLFLFILFLCFAAFIFPFYYPTLKHLKHHYTSALPPYRVFVLAGLVGVPFFVLFYKINISPTITAPVWIVPLFISVTMTTFHYYMLKLICFAFKIPDEAIDNYFTNAKPATKKTDAARLTLPRINLRQEIFFSTGVLASVFSTTIISLTNLTCTQFLLGCMTDYRAVIILFIVIMLSCILMGIFLWVPAYWVWTNKFAAYGKKKYLIYIFLLPISLFMLLLTTVIIWVPYMHTLSREDFWGVSFPICILTSLLQAVIFRYFVRKNETAAV